MTDQRLNTGAHDPRFPNRHPVPYGPTGTYRDALTARNALRVMIEDDDMLARYWSLLDSTNRATAPADWVRTFQRDCRLALADNATVMWIGDTVARGLEVSADSVPEPSGWDAYQLPPAGLALTQCPIFDRVMIDVDGTPTLVTHTAGLAVTGILWNRDTARKRLTVYPLAATRSMTFANQSATSHPIVVLPPGPMWGDPPFEFSFTPHGTTARQVVGWGHSSVHWPRFYTSLDYWCQTIATTDTRPVREYQRGGKRTRRGRHRPRKLGDVRVVKLRRAEPVADRDRVTGEGAGRTYSHRWIVGGGTGGFWRNYHVGPGRRQTRPTWVSPYVAGPDDKPLIVKDTVFKVDR